MSGEARLFVALELPAAVRLRLASWGSRAAARDPSLRPVEGAQLHLTLHFLGDRPPDEADGLRRALRDAGAEPRAVALELSGTLWLAPRRPHVLACAVNDASGALGALHALLRAPLEAAAPGWRPDRRPLRPHVTVARVRRGARPHPGAEPPAPRAAFSGEALTLLRSHPGPGGTRYEPLTRIALPEG